MKLKPRYESDTSTMLGFVMLYTILVFVIGGIVIWIVW